MKKRNRYVLFFVGLFFLTGVVYADTCPLAEKTNLRTYASNVTVSYVPGEQKVTDEEEGGEYVRYYIDTKIYNLDNTLRVEVEDNASGEKFNLDYNNMGTDGAITLREEDSSQIRNLTFTIYGQSVDCYGTVLRTMRLTLPKFNHLSERAICEDIPEYYLCQRYITYNVDSASFLDNVTKYKEKLDRQGSSGGDSGDSSAISKAINGVSKYRYLIAGVVVIAGVIVTIYVVKKRRSTE